MVYCRSPEKSVNNTKNNIGIAWGPVSMPKKMLCGVVISSFVVARKCNGETETDHRQRKHSRDHTHCCQCQCQCK